ncbi:MAG: hypothetical protein LC776_14600 [Acidobacteria bacterium]|nr:hypothetical protein [Acidobacteriota bacterium]
MSTVQEIEQAVSSLSTADLEQFREWFQRFDAEVWDRQFEQDAKSGKFDALADQAIDDFRSGRYKEL